MAPSEPPSEARELELVSKVELRIASATSDRKLGELVEKFLTPLLLKLASPHVSVRNEVIKVCRHIDVRLAPTDIKLPVEALLQQFRDVDNRLVRHFDIRYIKSGIDSIPVAERLQYFPKIIRGLPSVYASSKEQASGLFALFMRLLPHIRLPPRASAEDLALRTKFEIGDEEAFFLSSWLGKLILFQGPDRNGQPCLSASDTEFLSFNEVDFWDIPGRIKGAVNLREAKYVSIKFVASGVFAESERMRTALVASADSDSRIAEIGKDILKRALPALDLEDATLIQDLYALYLGSSPDIAPAAAPLKMRILDVFSKSVAAAKHHQSQIIVKDAVDPEYQGLEASRLRTAAFGFVNWMTRIGDEVLVPEALIDEIRILVEGQGWPDVAKTGSAQGDAAVLEARGRAYETIGLLMAGNARKRDILVDSPPSNPSVNLVSLIEWLFKSLLGDTSSREVSLSIESAISNALIAASSEALTDYEESELLRILRQSMLSDGGGRRLNNAAQQNRAAYPALRFVNRCFPFSNVQARLFNLLALGLDGKRRELIEEATNGLDPYLHSKNYHVSTQNRETTEASGAQAMELPSFEAFVRQIFHNNTNDNESQLLSISGSSTAVQLARNLLFHQALVSKYKPPTIDDQWERNIETAIANDEQSIDAIKSYLSVDISLDDEQWDALSTLLTQSFGMVVGEKPPQSVAKCLLDLCAFAPSRAIASIAHRYDELRDSTHSNNQSVREVVCHIFGILASHATESGTDLDKTADNLLGAVEKYSTAVGADANRVHGDLLALANWLCRLSYRVRPSEELLKGQVSGRQLPALLDKLGQLSAEVIQKSSDKQMQEGAASVLNLFELFAAAGPETAAMLEKERPSIVDALKKLSLGGSEIAIQSLGFLGFSNKGDWSADSPLTQLTDTLYSIHEKRAPELQFAVGAAFSLLAFDRDSKVLVGALDITGPELQASPRSDAAQKILEKVLDACKNTKPSLREAGAIWLLCLLEYGGHTNLMQENLTTCQNAFKALLSDKNTLNQESGSRGLTLVYERGNKEIKDALVSDLVGSFTQTKPSLSGNVAEDTELFEPGALPTEGGESVTTYKDIVNLANEVGDPNLIYRFMSLAANSAIWTSRAAFGRFGLSRVLSDASEDGYLSQNPKLYQALFRYRYDPNPGVSTAMKDIWTALVRDPTKTVEKYFDDILQDLLKNMMTKEWRTRQASCAALGDLIQGRPLTRYEKYLNEIWTKTFKVCDDIKGSVRTAALALARVLTGIVKRALEAGDASTKTSAAMLKQVLPFLLGPDGLEAGAKEVQVFALKTLLDIIKAGSQSSLRPFLPDLICRLLALLGSTEHEAINYIHLNAEKYGLNTQDIDDRRVAFTKMTPMMQAIERCLDHLDETSMKELRPRLMDTAKTVIGLPSRVGVSSVVISLATRRNFLFKQYADEFLTLLRTKHVLDRNDTISTSAAAACGYLARLASDKAILNMITWSKKQFFESEDERYRVIAGEMMHSFGKFATDRFASLSSEILPFVFLAKHDTHEASRDLFKSTWEDNVAGSRTVLLHLKEILTLCSQHLESTRWPIKHASAFAIAEAVKAAGNEISDVEAEALWPAVDKAMAGKTWTGKETVLESFVHLVQHSALASKDAAASTKMQTVVIREAKRNNAPYRQHSIKALGDFIKACPDLDWFEQTYDIVEELVDSLLEVLNERMDVDSTQAEGESSKTVAGKTLANAIRTLFISLNPAKKQGDTINSDLKKLLAVTTKALGEKDRWTNEAVFDGMRLLFDNLADVASSKPSESVLLEFAKPLFEQGDYPEQTRTKAAEAAQGLAKAAGSQQQKHYPQLGAYLKENIAKSQQADRSPSVKQAWAKTAEKLTES